MNTSKWILKDRTFNFAIQIVGLCKNLNNLQKEYVLSKQLLRSGTSIGANIREARNAVSSKDFINKLGIAQKECDETMYWLELLYHSNYIDNELYNQNIDEANQLYKMIKSSILTIKHRNS